MGSALLDTAFEPEGYASAEALRFQVAERLAAHRKRRAGARAQLPAERTRSQGVFNPASSSTSTTSSSDERGARIAAVVAERYSRSQSYCAYLAAESERTVRQAQAAAEMAVLNAQAMLEAQQTLLDALSWDGFDVDIASAEGDGAQLNVNSDGDPDHDPDRGIAKPDVELQRSLPEELGLWPEADAPRRRASNVRKTASARFRSAASATAANSRARRTSHGYRYEEWKDAEAMALDEEIAFRKSPVFEEPVGPAVPLPANLIEFPRQLVASRKARPRLAEGPLRDEEEADPGGGQLRIFEVDPAQIDTTPAAAPATLAAATPQWTSIWLDTPGHALAEGAIAGGQTAGGPESQLSAMPGTRAMNLPHAASLGRRVAAAVIDVGIILSGFLVCATVFVLTSCRWVLGQPGGPLGAALEHGLRTIKGQAASQPSEFLFAATLTFVFLYLLYQGLFFSLSEATPGMRCARIALCTFAEESPSRSAMRWRILAQLLSACPLGLGFLWAALDEERLSWHDRLCRVYQRSY
jgi:uncharacterized RDD family membrane protein YckC